MRIGRRYSRSAGTRSSAAASWFGTARAVSPGAGLGAGVGGGVFDPAAAAGCGVPSTGTGPGGGAVGSGFPSASTSPASQGAAGAGAPAPASPFGRTPGAAAGAVGAAAPAPAGRRSDASAAPAPGRASAASTRRAVQRRSCWRAGTGRSPGRPTAPGVAAPSQATARPGSIQAGARPGNDRSVTLKDMHVISAGSAPTLSAFYRPK